ncbi:hypothetical protein [Vibrio harveyi]|uniref:hypothetical protein n=1 Tax=Vibrio harveyi TaxID=669 RepID=UPI003CE99FC7
MKNVSMDVYTDSIRALALYAKTYGFESEEGSIFRDYLDACEENEVEPCPEVAALNIGSELSAPSIEKFEYEIIRSIQVQGSFDSVSEVDVSGYKEMLLSALRAQQIFNFEGYLDWDLVEVTIDEFACKQLERTLLGRITSKPAYHIETSLEINLSLCGELLTDDVDEAKHSIQSNLPEVVCRDGWILSSEDHRIIDR